MNPALGALFAGATCIALSPIFVRVSEAGPIATALPVMAALFAWLLLSEGLVPLQVVGGIVVLAGIYLARRGSGAGQ